jgi:site-specific DNA-methyltransferase (adenine-specific)
MDTKNIENPIITDKYTLYLGDCLEYMKTMPDKSVDAVITDPPYRLTSGGHGYQKGLCHNFEKWGYTNNGELFTVPEITEWMPIIFSKGMENSEFYVMSNDKNLRGTLNAADSAGYQLHNMIIWDKQIKITNKWFMKQCEFILYFWKGSARKINDMGTSQLFSMSPGNIGNKEHPSEKPIELMRMIIENSTDKTAVIFDPFMGSGTTGVACMQLGRRFIGCEIDPGYFEIARKRIEAAAAQMLLPLENHAQIKE